MEVEKNVFASVVEAMILKVGHSAVIPVNSSMYYTIYAVYTFSTEYTAKKCYVDQSNSTATVLFCSMEC